MSSVSPYVFPGVAALSPERVISKVSEHTNVSVADIKGKSRKPERVYARQLAAYMIKRVIPFISNSNIAMAIGYAEHSMVTHCITRINEDIEVIRGRKKEIEELLIEILKHASSTGNI